MVADIKLRKLSRDMTVIIIIPLSSRAGAAYDELSVYVNPVSQVFVL